MRIVHAEYIGGGNRRVEVPRGEGTFDLGSFTLVPGGKIHGVVSDPEGLPVPGATVEVPRYGPDRDQERTTTTKLDGTFHLAGLPHDLVDLDVRAEGFAAMTLRGARPDSGEPILIELQTGATLSVRVVDDAGNPVAGASLRLEPDQQTLTRLGGWSSVDFFKSTGRDGRFRFENVGAGTWTLEAEDGAAKARLEAIELAPETERVVELQLDGQNRLTVTVTTFQGEPLSEASILIQPESTLFYSSAFGMTDASGHARFGITPGPATVHARHQKYQDDSRKIVLEPGNNELAIQLGSGGTIAGTVRSADGTPLAAATVQAHSEDDVDTPVRYRRHGDWAKTLSNGQGAVPHLRTRTGKVPPRRPGARLRSRRSRSGLRHQRAERGRRRHHPRAGRLDPRNRERTQSHRIEPGANQSLESSPMANHGARQRGELRPEGRTRDSVRPETR